MSSVVPATGELLEQVLDETYPIWGEGLSRAAYGRFNRAQLNTAWGARCLQRLALVSPAGQLLSTLKRYDMNARLDGVQVRVLGIGAVFTPARLRRRGLAAQLIERVLASAREEGFHLSLLFSAIGSEYYRRFGFDVVPLEQLALGVRYKPGSPAMLVRGGEDRDTRFLAEMHEARVQIARCRFSLERDPDFIRFTIARKRLLAGLGPPGFRQLEYFVVDEADRPAAYVVMLNTDGGRMITEGGDRDPTGARLGALLQALLARTPHERLAPIRGWLPANLRPPQLDVLRSERPAVTMMLRSFQPAVAIAPPLVAGDVFYHLGDVV